MSTLITAVVGLAERVGTAQKTWRLHDFYIPSTDWIAPGWTLEKMAEHTLSFPKTLALDVHCKAHEVDNLYVVDASFFPSSCAVNPALTIMANALRVGDHLRERLA